MRQGFANSGCDSHALSLGRYRPLAQPTITVVEFFSFPPVAGVKVRLIFALSLRPLCLDRAAASRFVRVSLTVSVVAPLAFLLTLERPLPDAASFPADGTFTWIVAVLPLTL